MGKLSKTKAKEPVTIRFKQLAKGSKSIYLDIYRNKIRSYEFLKMYLIPEKTAADKEANAMTLDAAQAIKAQRIQEIFRGEAGIKTYHGRSILLMDWMQEQQDRAAYNAKMAGRRMMTCAETIAATKKHLSRYISERYKNRRITLAEVDKSFCAGFVQYLKSSGLSANTCCLYYSKLSAAMNVAYKRELIRINPATLLESHQQAKMQQVQRDYLTANELRILNATPCPNEHVKAAFLFSCMCGLRWCDIKALTWEKVNTSDEPWQVETRMIKSQKCIYLPLNMEARRFLPSRNEKDPKDLIFSLPTFNTVNKDIRKWVKYAGISKSITFHCARHTFATLLITLGADLYTTSKLLGHSDIKVTQIYAAMIDKKKQEAVSLMGGLF